jgi:hypothetical protein
MFSWSNDCLAASSALALVHGVAAHSSHAVDNRNKTRKHTAKKSATTRNDENTSPDAGHIGNTSTISHASPAANGGDDSGAFASSGQVSSSPESGEEGDNDDHDDDVGVFALSDSLSLVQGYNLSNTNQFKSEIEKNAELGNFITSLQHLPQLYICSANSDSTFSSSSTITTTSSSAQKILTIPFESAPESVTCIDAPSTGALSRIVDGNDVLQAVPWQRIKEMNLGDQNPFTCLRII